MQALGWSSVAIDFDVQNALRLHFGVPFHDRQGYVRQAITVADWSSLARSTPSGVGLLSYGAVEDVQRFAFEHALKADPEFLVHRLARLRSDPGCLIVVDTPPGPSPALDAISRIVDLRVAVMLPDAASVSLLPLITDGSLPSAANSALRVVVNQVDRRARLNADVTDFICRQVGSALAATIHRDESFAEAAASRRSVLDYAPSSVAAQGIAALAARFDAFLRGETMLQRAQR
jgi:cellulose synthase operon protein YhjQ